MFPVVAPYVPAYENLSARVGQGDGVGCFGVSGVAAHGERVGDYDVRARLDEDGVTALRRGWYVQALSRRLEVDDQPGRILQLEHPVAERLAREEVHEHAAVRR